MPLPGHASLTSRTGEQIAIDFAAAYSGGTPGGGAVWDIRLVGAITITITIPNGRPLPDAFCVIVSDFGSAIFERGGSAYRGRIVYANPGETFLIRTASMGLQYDRYQSYTFLPVGLNSQGGSLIDPVNGTARFQTNLYYGTPFPSTPGGLWPVG